MLRCALLSLVLCPLARATPPQPAAEAAGIVVDASATADPVPAAPLETASEGDSRTAANDERAGTASVADPPTTPVLTCTAP